MGDTGASHQAPSQLEREGWSSAQKAARPGPAWPRQRSHCPGSSCSAPQENLLCFRQVCERLFAKRARQHKERQRTWPVAGAGAGRATLLREEMPRSSSRRTTGTGEKAASRTSSASTCAKRGQSKKVKTKRERERVKIRIETHANKLNEQHKKSRTRSSWL